MNPQVCAGPEPARVSVFTAAKTSSLLKKERNYKHAAAVSSGSNLRTGPLSLRGLNDARRTSGNLEGARRNTLSAGLTPSKFKLQYGGIMEGVGDKWRQMVRLWQLVSSPEKRKHFNIITYSLAIPFPAFPFHEAISAFFQSITVCGFFLRVNHLIYQSSCTNGCLKDSRGYLKHMSYFHSLSRLTHMVNGLI